MNRALAALGLAGLVGCASAPPAGIVRRDIRETRDVGSARYDIHVIAERTRPGTFPGHELHMKYRLTGEKHWSELQARTEFIGTPHEYAQLGIIKDGQRLHMTDGRTGPRDDIPDEAFLDGAPAGDRTVDWVDHALLAGMQVRSEGMLHATALRAEAMQEELRKHLDQDHR
jgi:hypothetical protein